MNRVDDGLPPHSEKAEAGVLGCLLQDPKVASELIATISLQDLYLERHKIIYGAIRAILAEGGLPDSVTVCRHLHEKGRTGDAGGDTAVAALLDAAPSAANFDYWLSDLRKFRLKRELLGVANDARRLALDGSPDMSQLPDILAGVQAIEERQEDTELDRLRFRWNEKPDRPSPVFLLKGVPVSTCGNLTNIVAGVKAGKSAVIGAMLAATMTSINSDADTFGFHSSNPEGLAVLHFDTEQSPHDWRCGIERAVSRAKLPEPPPWLVSYCLTAKQPAEARRLVQMAISGAKAKFGGLRAVLIDGVGDLTPDVNDPKLSTELVASLHAIAIKHRCPVVCVLHFNPGSEKVRGHIGSQLERKAESNLRLDKNSDGVTVIWSARQRKGNIPKESGPRFHWSEEVGMHVSCTTICKVKPSARAQKGIKLCDQVFSAQPSMRYEELKVAIQAQENCSSATAGRRIAEWEALDVIKKRTDGLWAYRGAEWGERNNSATITSS